MKIIFLALLLICPLFFGCGGGKMIITANDLKYPVSASNSVFDNENSIISKNIDLSENPDTSSYFEFSVSKSTIAWTLIPLSKDPDISEKLNSIIEEKNGDAIINLQVYTTQNPLICLGSIIPIIPTPISATIKGYVIKFKK